jgi:ribosomal protein L34E
MAAAHAEWLSGTVLLPLDIRVLSLRKFRENFGTEGLIDAFAHFMGLTSSMAANAVEMCSMQRVIDGAEHPDRLSDRLNLPTPFGALQGVILASKVDETKTCATCAFRLGSVANQSPVTTSDADYCAHEGERPFMCHEGVHEGGEPTKACAGFAQLRTARKEGGKV